MCWRVLEPSWKRLEASKSFEKPFQKRPDQTQQTLKSLWFSLHFKVVGLLGALSVLEATLRRLGAPGRPLEASWRSVLHVLDRFGVDVGPLGPPLGFQKRPQIDETSIRRLSWAPKWPTGPTLKNTIKPQ